MVCDGGFVLTLTVLLLGTTDSFPDESTLVNA